jgi:hypothetical protein
MTTLAPIYSRSKADHLASLATLGLGLVLLISGASKITQPQRFLAAISAFQMLTPAANLFVAAVLPWLEVSFGIGMASGILEESSLVGAVALFALFCAANAFAISRRLTIECGCFDFGSDVSLVGTWTFLRSAGLLAVAIWLYCRAITSRNRA